MKTQCLLKRKEYHTTAWIDSEVTELGLLVEITELGGLWEIVEIYPHRSTHLASNLLTTIHSHGPTDRDDKTQ
jgi:hypothetical protein